MPAHIVRLLLLLGAILLLAVIARNYILDPSYYQFGNYRGDAVVELAAGAPQFRGSAYCQACHTDRHTEWTASTHSNVKCEVCHGPAREHPADGPLPKPTDTIKLCTQCHEAMPTRPAAQPQIVVAEHPFLHEEALQCVSCHNPHAPALGARREPAARRAGISPAEAESVAPVAVKETQASIPALAASCASCHGADGRGVGSNPALAGSERATLARQLEQYRSGALQNPMMNAIAGPLSDEDIASLAKHYASLPQGQTQ